MGKEATCRVDFGRQSSEGKALLESNEILFRGDFRLKIARPQIQSLTASQGKLKVEFAGDVAVFHLGDQAEKWAHKFLNPPSRLEKLGIKKGTRVSFVGPPEPAFKQELEAVGATIVHSSPDIVFLTASATADLDQIAAQDASSAIWVIFPKGVKTITENQVIAAGRAAGLTDTKVASFSATHTALKFSHRKSK